MLIGGPRHSTKSFTYNQDTRTFSTEASTIGHYADGNFMGQIYDDACDEGLTLVSHITSREVTYYLRHVKRDADGDVLYWTLVETPRTKYGTTVIVFND